MLIFFYSTARHLCNYISSESPCRSSVSNFPSERIYQGKFHIKYYIWSIYQFSFHFKSECMRYDGEREILIATPFRDISETIKYGNVISPIISARNCWNPIDLTVLLSSVILIGIVLIIIFIGCCAFACNYIKKKCEESPGCKATSLPILRF